jgi:hypothetical protein
MKSRLEATERILKLRKEQDLQLRDSIFMATREVRIIVSTGVDFLFPPYVLICIAGTASIGCIRHATTTARTSARLQQP